MVASTYNASLTGAWQLVTATAGNVVVNNYSQSDSVFLASTDGSTPSETSPNRGVELKPAGIGYSTGTANITVETGESLWIKGSQQTPTPVVIVGTAILIGSAI